MQGSSSLRSRRPPQTVEQKKLLTRAPTHDESLAQRSTEDARDRLRKAAAWQWLMRHGSGTDHALQLQHRINVVETSAAKRSALLTRRSIVGTHIRQPSRFAQQAMRVPAADSDNVELSGLPAQQQHQQRPNLDGQQEYGASSPNYGAVEEHFVDSTKTSAAHNLKQKKQRLHFHALQKLLHKLILMSKSSVAKKRSSTSSRGIFSHGRNLRDVDEVHYHHYIHHHHFHYYHREVCSLEEIQLLKQNQVHTSIERRRSRRHSESDHSQPQRMQSPYELEESEEEEEEDDDDDDDDGHQIVQGTRHVFRRHSHHFSNYHQHHPSNSSLHERTMVIAESSPTFATKESHSQRFATIADMHLSLRRKQPNCCGDEEHNKSTIRRSGSERRFVEEDSVAFMKSSPNHGMNARHF